MRRNLHLFLIRSTSYWKNQIFNKIVFTDAKYQNYAIIKVIEISLDNETDLDIVRSIIYRNEKIGVRQEIGNLLQIYDANDYRYSNIVGKSETSTRDSDVKQYRTRNSSKTKDSNDKVEFSLKIGDKDINAQGEETSKLVAIHNLREQDLLKVLDLGGFPMPSIAVTKANIPHDNFGNIIIIFDKDIIDPQKSAKNIVYDKDALKYNFKNDNI